MTWLKDEEAGAALDRLQFHKVKDSSIQRAERTYLNFLSLLAVAKEVEGSFLHLDEIYWRDVHGGGEPKTYSGNDPEMVLVNQRSEYCRRLEAMIRAIYEAATVTIGIVSAEAQRQPELYDWSLKKFAYDNPAMLERMDQHALQMAWAVTEFRNKIISHHAFSRTYSFMSGNAGCRLVAIGPGVFPDLSPSDIEELTRLWDEYGSLTNGPDTDNYYQQREFLFGAVPILTDGTLNPDRTSIDKIVERYGVPSATLDEISGSVRSLIIALAALV